MKSKVKLHEITLFSSDKLLVFQKPQGIASIPTRNPDEPAFSTMVRREFPQALVVHRLDRDTSGLIIFALDADVHRELQLGWDQVTKDYQMFSPAAPGLPDTFLESSPIVPSQGGRHKSRIDPKGKASSSEFSRIGRGKRFDFWRVRIFSGRTHQIRVHGAHRGIPVLGDPLYGSHHWRGPFTIADLKPKVGGLPKPLLSRLALHACTLDLGPNLCQYMGIDHLRFTSELAHDLQPWKKAWEKYDKRE